MSGISNGRLSYWDNLKAILIFFVVLGHFLIPVYDKWRSTNTVFWWIYLFHMPAFVFVSGYFSKGYVRKKEERVSRLLGFLILYLGYIVLLWLLSIRSGKPLPSLSLFTTSRPPWYLLSMFFWYLLIPLFAQLPPALAVVVSVVFGLLIGTDSNAGHFLTMSRSFVFFPFFLAGYFFPGDKPKLSRPAIRIGGAVLLAAAFVLLFLKGMDNISRLSILYGAASYEKLHLSNIQGIFYRACWYAISSILVCALFALIPEKRMFFTFIGERTISIYIIHILIRDILIRIGAYKHFGEGKWMLLSCALVSCAVIALSSIKWFSAFLNKAFHLPIRTAGKTEDDRSGSNGNGV